MMQMDLGQAVQLNHLLRSKSYFQEASQMILVEDRHMVRALVPRALWLSDCEQDQELGVELHREWSGCMGKSFRCAACRRHAPCWNHPYCHCPPHYRRSCRLAYYGWFMNIDPTSFRPALSIVASPKNAPQFLNLPARRNDVDSLDSLVPVWVEHWDYAPLLRTPLTQSHIGHRSNPSITATPLKPPTSQRIFMRSPMEGFDLG